MSPVSPSVWPGSPSLSACLPASPRSTTTPRRSWWWDPGAAPASTPAASTGSCRQLLTTPLPTPPCPWPVPRLHPGSPTCLRTMRPHQGRYLPPLQDSRTPTLFLSPTLTPSPLHLLIRHLHHRSTAFPSLLRVRHLLRPSPSTPYGDTRRTAMSQRRTTAHFELLIQTEVFYRTCRTTRPASISTVLQLLWFHCDSHCSNKERKALRMIQTVTFSKLNWVQYKYLHKNM